MPFLQNGRAVHGVMQGDSRPVELIPNLVDYPDGRKIADRERMITFYPLADINRAAEGIRNNGDGDQAGAADAGIGSEQILLRHAWLDPAIHRSRARLRF